MHKQSFKVKLDARHKQFDYLVGTDNPLPFIYKIRTNPVFYSFFDKVEHYLSKVSPKLELYLEQQRAKANQAKINYLKKQAKLNKLEQDKLPIKVQLEYLNHISEQDALLMALGAIDRIHTAPLSYLGLFPYETGYIYEVQEGGAGKAYTPLLLQQYAEKKKQIDPDNPLQVYLKTSSKTVLVEISEAGIHSLVIPDSLALSVPLIENGSNIDLHPIYTDNSTQVLRQSKTFFKWSFLFLVFAYLLGPSDVAIPKLDTNKLDNLPNLQVNLLTKAHQTSQVSKVEFVANKWKASTENPNNETKK